MKLGSSLGKCNIKCQNYTYKCAGCNDTPIKTWIASSCSLKVKSSSVHMNEEHQEFQDWLFSCNGLVGNSCIHVTPGTGAYVYSPNSGETETGGSLECTGLFERPLPKVGTTEADIWHGTLSSTCKYTHEFTPECTQGYTHINLYIHHLRAPLQKE